MNPVLLLAVGMLIVYAGVTGRAEAMWTALTTAKAPTDTAGADGTKTKQSSAGGGATPAQRSNPSTK